MKKYYIAAASLLALTATPAFAQDSESSSSNDGQPSGPRIEAFIAYDRFDVGVNDTEDFDGDAEDFGYGVAIGYDVSTDFLSFGVDAEVSGSGIELTETLDNQVIEGVVVDGTASLGAGLEYYLGGRIAAPVTDNSSVYIKAGWAWSTLDLDLAGTVDGVADSVEVDFDIDGFRIGAGFEQRIGDNAFLKLEYRYTDYSGGEINALGETLDIDALFQEANIDRHQVVAGGGFRF